MKREELLYKLTGTEEPMFLTERENKMIDIFLEILEQSRQADVSGSLPSDEKIMEKQRQIYNNEGNTAAYWFYEGINWLKNEIVKFSNDR